MKPKEFMLENKVATKESIELAKEKLGECYEKIIEIIKSYMDMPEDHIKLVAVWIIGTYFHDTFTTYPFLFINAMRGSGKTRLLRIISNLSKEGKGRVQTGITESTLFRMPKGQTLVLDELENIGSKDRACLREYMNASYKRGGTVPRNKKVRFQGQDEWIIEHFQPFKPIAMANIHGMDEVLGDRCISFTLEKSNNPAKTKKGEDFEDNPTFEYVKRTLDQISVVSVVTLRKKNYITAWNKYIDFKYCDITTLHTQTTQTTQTTQNKEEGEEVIGKKRELLKEKEELEEIFRKVDNLEIDGRNLELLFPLLIVSRMVGPEVFNEVILIGKEIIKSKKEDEFTESRDVILYDFISKQESTLNFIPLKLLTTDFKTWLGSDDEWISERWMGRALKRLNLLIDRKRMASGRFVIINSVKAKEKLKIFKKEESDDE